MSLVGHAEQVAALREAAGGGRLHHGWLLAGPQGIGKATFAEAAAQWLLAVAAGPAPDGTGFAVAAEHPTRRLVAAGTHPDFRILQRLVKDRSEEQARSITVEQVRSLQAMFATTPSLSPRRVVVIDAIDDLERGAANALLKSLEEPPAGTIFLLVSHAPGRLLPTIRSRCRLLRFGRLAEAESAAVLAAALPDASGRDVAQLARISDGAPGRAIRFAGLDVGELDASLDRLARDGDPTNALRSELARKLSGKAAQGRYEAFLERAPSRIAAAAREGGRDPALVAELWARARGIAEGAVRLSMDPQLTTFELAGLVARLAPEAAPAKA